MASKIAKSKNNFTEMSDEERKSCQCRARRDQIRIRRLKSPLATEDEMDDFFKEYKKLISFIVWKHN